MDYMWDSMKLIFSIFMEKFKSCSKNPNIIFIDHHKLHHFLISIWCQYFIYPQYYEAQKKLGLLIYRMGATYKPINLIQFHSQEPSMLTIMFTNLQKVFLFLELWERLIQFYLMWVGCLAYFLQLSPFS